MGTGAHKLRHRLALLLMVVVGSVSAGVSSARADEVVISPKARELFQSGVGFLEDPEGPRYEEAYRAFKAAYADSPSPKILGNIGLCAMKLERDGEAIDAYRRYLVEAEDIDPEERSQIQRDLKLLENGQAKLSLEVESGVVVVDQRQPARGPAVTNRYGPVKDDHIELGLRAGNHRVRIEHPDGRSKELSLELAPRSSREETVELDAPASDGGTEAKPRHMELAFVKRPLTLPRFTLSPALGVRYGRRALDEESAEAVGGVDLLMTSFSPVENLQLDLKPLPLEFLPQADYGTASFGATYRFLDEVVELGSGVELGHWLGIYRERRFFLDLAVLKALAHLGEYGRLDGAFELTFLFRNPVAIGMDVPLRLAVQPHEMFYMGLGTGVGIFDFRDADGTLFIPLGVFAGVSVPSGDDPLLDIGVSFDFPYLFQPGADREVEPRTYLGALTMRMYFFL